MRGQALLDLPSLDDLGLLDHHDGALGPQLVERGHDPLAVADHDAPGTGHQTTFSGPVQLNGEEPYCCGGVGYSSGPPSRSSGGGT